MTPLKEMCERRDELLKIQQNDPSAWYSELQAELTELYNAISLRERYLQRYINHAPHVLEMVKTSLEKFTHMPNTEETRQLVRDDVAGVIRGLLVRGQVFGKTDSDDLEYLLNNAIQIS